MAGALVESWKLTTIGMWYDRLDHDGALKLICENFDWEGLWEAAAELNQLCAAREMDLKIPRNRDQGVMKDRVGILGKAVLASMIELKGRADPPVYYVSSSNLCHVPGVIKDNVQAEPAVTARLDNIEKMVENLAKGFSEMKASRARQEWPALQVNGAEVPSSPLPPRQGFSQTQPVHTIARSRVEAAAGHPPINRSRSPSTKRTAEEAELHSSLRPEPAWSTVVGRNQGRRQRPVQLGTAKLAITARGEAAPYSIVVGNTHPESTEEIIREVLKNISEAGSEESDPLEILEVECLTKPRTDGRRIWSRTWRVQVPNRFREYMERPEAYPSGWTSRKYFPPKAQRPEVAELYPAVSQPPVKKPNVGEGNRGEYSS